MKAISRGVSITVIGFVLGSQTFMAMIGSLIVSSWMAKNPIRNLMLGFILIVIGVFLLGMLEWVYDKERFLMYSFLTQCTIGMGSGMILNASTSILGSFEEDEREKFQGMIEFNNGLSFFLGSIIGAALNQIGDYYLPFLFFAGLSVLALPAIYINLYNSGQPFKISNKDDTNLKKIPLTDLFRKPRFFFGIFAFFNLSICMNYLNPVLTIFAHTQYGLSTSEVGLINGVPGFTYAIACRYVYLIT